MILAAAALLAVAGRAATAPSATGWALAWSDEFNGPADSAPDPATWTPEVGGDGWGNRELECYTSRTENARLDGRGHLLIEARRERMGKNDYTSARLITLGKRTWQYGRFEARMKLPPGQGIWPAFWMMGDNVKTVDWPACGEVDVMEVIGKEPGRLVGTMHGPGYADEGVGGSVDLPKGATFADDFHVFGLEWEPGVLRWTLDGKVYQTRTPQDLGSNPWKFDRPFFLLVNLAIGGEWPGSPDAQTPFPARMLIDWVRVWSRPGTGAVTPAGSATPPR